jgi:hypothetical protein
MSKIIKMSWCALLVMPALSFAATANTITTHATPLMGEMLGFWGIMAAAACLILGAIAGMPVGTPTPALEGVSLAGCIHFMPLIALGDSWPPCIQNAAVILTLVWMVTFLAMFSGVFIKWRDWESFSFVELPLTGIRIMRRMARQRTYQ